MKGRKNNLMNKLGKALTQCIYSLFVLFWLGIMILDLFFSNISYSCKKEFLLSNIQLLILGCLIYLFICLLSFWLSKKNVHIQVKRVNINILTLLLFCIQIYVFYNIYFSTNTWDPGTIYTTAEKISRGNASDLWNQYFSMYPNNQLLVYLQAIMIRFNRGFGVLDTEGIFFMIVVQCSMTSLSGKILYDNLRIMGASKKYAIGGWIVFVLLLGLSGWNVVTYSDMMGLIFPLVVFRLYLSLKNDENKALIKWILIIGLSYIGFKIKPTAIIVFIAIIINEILHFLCNFELKTISLKIKSFIKILIPGVLCILVLSSLINVAVNSTGLKINEEQNMGTLHWMMMGLNSESDGVWNGDDVELSAGITSKASRTEMQISVIKNRLNEYGIDGFLKHMAKKSLVNFNDGTFAWGCEGGFYDTVYPDKNTVVAPLLKNIYYNTGLYYLYFSTINQLLWIFILFSSVGVVLKKKSKESLTIVLSLIGIILFHMLFEARARYLILYVPFFIMTSMLSLQNLEMNIRKRLLDRKA